MEQFIYERVPISLVSCMHAHKHMGEAIHNPAAGFMLFCHFSELAPAVLYQPCYKILKMIGPHFGAPQESIKKSTVTGVGLHFLIRCDLSGHSNFWGVRHDEVELTTNYFWYAVNYSLTSILDQWQGLARSTAVAKTHERKGASFQCHSENKVCVSVPTEGGCESWLANSCYWDELLTRAVDHLLWSTGSSTTVIIVLIV